MKQQPSITTKTFGLIDNNPVQLFQLTNAQGMILEIINYRGIITKLMVPNREHNLLDITLGYDQLEQYIADNNTYFGAIVGRYANRIAGAEFRLDGTTYQLDKNHGQHCLHGGFGGINKTIWQAETTENDTELQLILTYNSPEGEQGFPGNLALKISYSLKKLTNEFSITYHATTDHITHLNLTNHAYFNLSGAGNGDILQHQLKINANHYTETDNDQIPTGKILPVFNTPFDFKQEKKIAKDINQDHPQLLCGRGYDHNFVLEKSAENALDFAAYAYSQTSGISMEVYTTYPGIQFYSGNHLTKIVGAKANQTYDFRSGFCLETQYFPDTMHHANFPSSKITPQKACQHLTVYKFKSA